MDSYDEMDIASDRDNSVDTVDSYHLEGRPYRQILSAKRLTLGTSDNNNRPRRPEDMPILLKTSNEMPLPHHFQSPFFNHHHHHNILTLSPIQSPTSSPQYHTTMHSSESWYPKNWSNANYSPAAFSSSPYSRQPTNRTPNSAVKRNQDGLQKFDEDWGPTLCQYYEEEEEDKNETETNLKKKRIVQ